MHQFYRIFLAPVVILSVLSPVAFAQVDAEQINRWLRTNDCFKCHAVDKEKMAPSYRAIAQKYAGDSAAKSKIIHHLRSGRTVTLSNDHEVAHIIVDEEVPGLTEGLVTWVLSR